MSDTDRDALLDHAVLIDRAVASLAHIVPNETAARNVWNYIASPGPVRDAILAVARPIDGITLSPEEARTVIEGITLAAEVTRQWYHLIATPLSVVMTKMQNDLDRLAARLGAASS